MYSTSYLAPCHSYRAVMAGFLFLTEYVYMTYIVIIVYANIAIKHAENG